MAAQFQLTARRVNTPASISAAHLGESPTWDDENKVLWWIDILDQTLYVGQPAAGGLCDFERVAKLPLKGHRVGFVVHTKAAAAAAESGASGKATYHAIWGSQSGLFYTPYLKDLPWCSAGATAKQTKLHATADAPQHRRLADFPLSTFPLQGGRVYRFNDGKVGPDGSLWSGGMMERSAQFTKRDPGCGALLQWTPQNAAFPFAVGASGVTVSNGIGWSPAGDFLYHIDTPTAVVRAYPYHRGAAGAPGRIVQSEGYVFWTLPADRKARGATLDGLCVDSAGAVWVALAGIGEVVRLQSSTKEKDGDKTAVPPQVAITGVVTVPGVTLSTSCCFGGADLTTLYITTARGTDPAAAAKCTQAGAGFVYAVNLKGIAKGMPASRLQLPASMPLSRL